MKRIERNKRKSIFKRKGFKQALSLIMILFMCLVLLPMRPTEAAGQTYTVYFDASSKPDDEWFISSKYKFIAHAWKDGSPGRDVDMVKSSKGDNIYECEIPSDYTNILFVKKNASSGSWEVKTPNLTIPSGYTSPCFKYSGRVSGNKDDGAYLVELGSDYWSDLANFNAGYIYLDVSGMNINSSYDWSDSPQTKLKIQVTDVNGLKGASGTAIIDGIDYVYWDTSGWPSDKTFTIIYESWDIANSQSYARTSGATTVSNAKGQSFYWDGSSTTLINDKNAYVLTQGVRRVSKAGSEIGFVDMIGSLSIGNIKAVFAIDESFTTRSEDIKAKSIDNETSKVKFTVPADTPDGAYQYVRFKNGDNYITGTYKVTSSVTDGTDININSGNSVLYYGATENPNGTKYSYWGKENTANSSINGRTLYLDNISFLSSEETKIQIGAGDPVILSQDANDDKTLSYTMPSGTTQKTKITIIKSDGTKYHFFWNVSDLDNNNVVTTSNNIAVVLGKYSKTYTIYFDATLSKLSYKVSSDSKHKEDKPDLSIPKDDGKVYCWLWNKSNGNENSGLKEMTKVSTITKGNNSWNDLYKIDLSESEWEKYSGVVFFSTGCKDSLTCNKTVDLTIDKSLSSPCFYADDSDDIIYGTNKKRTGYWDNVCTIRDPEKQAAKDGNDSVTNAQKNENSIVDIAEGNFENERDTNAKYVTTTFYDFYSDYELNGKNRDTYNYNDQESGNDKVYIHRFYQPFRQFNQALSSYYEFNQASNPIYWGNFQNYDGSKFSSIADTLNLYGYNKTSVYPANKQTQTYSKFFFNNNSMWGYGSNIATYNPSDTVCKDIAFTHGKNAVLGLVKDTLDSDGNLQIESGNSEAVKAPYFDEDFLNGNNSKNTKLGKVYKNVEFPFQSVKLKSKSDPAAQGEVAYWVFDSRGRKDADGGEPISGMSLEMKQDPTTKQYYLKNRGNNENDKVKGELAEGVATSEGNFFPFNRSENEVSGDLQQSGKAARLNYGFAMKMGFDFRLTENGMVTTDAKDEATGKDEEVPIEFNFSGDDDVWIFIDGQLVLDIGGGHGRVEGTLNFSQEGNTNSQRTKIGYSISSAKNDSEGGGLTAPKTGTLTINGAPTSTHTLTMFYMERGLWESNMRVTFNFPDDNTLQVEKQIDTTDVNEIFKDTFEKNTDKLFKFNIQNKVTHYGAKDTNENTDAKPFVFNDTLSADTLKASDDKNTFCNVTNFDKDKDKDNPGVALWNAKLSDESFQFEDKRFGIVSPKNGKDTIMNIPAGNRKLLQFDCYLQNNMNLPMRDFSIELEDSSGNKIRGRLDSSKTKGISEVKMNQWQTVTIELEKLKDITAYNNFHFDSVKYFKFNCCYSKNIYLDNIKFVPEEKVSAVVGFKTQQDQIPDYGSASGPELKNATNAVFELKNKDNTSSYEKVDANGNFMLGDRSVATFSNQFRRGSYISVSEEGVNPEVFKTKWTIFENDQPVERYGSSTKLENPSSIPSLVDRDNLFIDNSDGTRNIPIDDGRTEKTDDKSSEANYTGTRPTGNSIVFRSYKSPDDETSNTKLKALFVNTVRTGSIAIEKSKAKDSPDLIGQYKFRVTFTNVAGMSMESDKIVKEYTLNVGETKVITGIPAGTQYYIEEIEATDKAKVEDIKVKESNKGNDEYTINSENKTVTGVVKADDEEGATATTYTFSNTTRQKISIDLNKVWKDENGNINNSDSSLPEFITVQLQRRIKDSGNKFEPVTIDGKNYVEVKPSYDSEGNTQWKYTFSNLDKFAKIENGTESDEYEYKVVEVEVKAGVATIPEDNMITLNGKNYIITLGDITKDIEDETKYNTTITNKIKLCSIEITKADLESKNTITDSEAKFKIQKLKDDKEYSNDNVDSITSADYDGDSEEKSTTDGVVKFENLEAGTYLIEEVQAPSGYIKLGKSFIIEVPCEYTAGKIVDGVEAVEDGTKTDIKLTVYNPKGAILPISGLKGIQLYLLIGVLTMLLSAGVYTVVKVRKSKKIS